MSWWNTPVPLWQLAVVVTAYVIYKELVKLAVKLTYKRLRDQHNARRTARTLLGQPADESPQLPAPREVQRPLELDDQSSATHPRSGA